MENARHLTHMALSGVDLAIIAVYFLLVFSIGMYFALVSDPDGHTILLSGDLADAAPAG